MCLRKPEDDISRYLASGSDPQGFAELLERILPSFLPLKSKLRADHASMVCAEVSAYYIVTGLHWYVKHVNQTVKYVVTIKQHRKKAKLC